MYEKALTFVRALFWVTNLYYYENFIIIRSDELLSLEIIIRNTKRCNGNNKMKIQQINY